MSWDAQLERASFRGVEFDVVSTEDSIERRIVAHEYPYKDGAELEDLGRRPRPARFVAVFHGPQYEADLSSFLLVADEGKTGPMRHPVFGTWQAKVTRISMRHETSRRDHCEVELELQEDALDTELPTLFSVEAAKHELAISSAAVSEELVILDEDLPDVETFVNDALDFIDDVESITDDLTARLDQMHQGMLNAVATAKAIGDVKSWPIVRACRRTMMAATRLKKRVERMVPTASKKRLPVHTPLAAVATSLYGDAERADELLRLNKIRNPFMVPPGTELKTFDA